jgi:aminoglycoside phosphotransferase family enzyme/predicted kinase
VELRQTHMSWLFFVGDEVYKVKKPVRFAFADFSTLEQRRRFCEEELRLNRRLAPDTYLGLAPVVRGADGALAVEGEGEAVDWAVHMRRLPSHRMLDRLLEQGEIDNERLRALSQVLAAFHERADTGPGVDEHGSWQAVHDLVLGNLEELAPAVGEMGDPDGHAVLSPASHAFLQQGLSRFLQTHRRLVESRARRGRVRDGHGDLHAGNVCFAEGGLVLYDCLEFSTALRCADVAADLAFLVMDLDHRGFRAHGRWLVEAYARAAGDGGLPWLMDFYKSHRALVRAKVAWLRAGEPGREPAAVATDLRDAAGYASLAASYHLPPALLLMCGLPACGKSTLARRLAAALDGTVLRSDVLRKRLAGLPPTSRATADYGTGLYAADHTERTYRLLGRRALDALRRGRVVVADATFSRAAWRRRLLDVATRLGYPALVVHMSCPEEVARERLAARAQQPQEVSDADVDVYARAVETFEVPDELEDAQRVAAPYGRSDELVVATVIDRILGQSAAGGGGAPSGRQSP